jgi:hypothetical protein
MATFVAMTGRGDACADITGAEKKAGMAAAVLPASSFSYVTAAPAAVHVRLRVGMRRTYRARFRPTSNTSGIAATDAAVYK